MEVVIFMLLLIYGINGDGIPGNYTRLTANGYYGHGDGEGNISRCLGSYNDLEPQVLSRYRDASGKPGSGIYGGNNLWFGSYGECNKIPNSRYCLAIFDALFPLQKNMKWWKINGLQYGVCIPNTCTNDNIRNKLGYILKNISMIPVQPIHPIQPMILHCAKDPEYTTGVVLTIVFFGICIFLCLLATMLEIKKELYKVNDKPNQEKIDELSMDKTENEKTPLLHGNGHPAVTPNKSSGVSWYKIFNCLSLIRNTSFIFNTNVGKSDLTYLHGIRVISLFWIILIHVSMKMIAVPYFPSSLHFTENQNDVKDFVKRILYMVLISPAAVDTFFLLSGLLVMYVNLKKQGKNNGKINWFKFYFHRFWRLTPSYMFAILFLTKLQPFFGDGPLWYRISEYTSVCSDYWWTNLLYINNFHPNHLFKTCIIQTWYLAVDMQLFVVSPILIIVALRCGFRPLLAFASVGILASMVTIASLVGDKDLTTLPVPLRSRVGFNDDVYNKPYCRAQPYIVGMVLGYIIFKHMGAKFRFKWYQALFIWCLAIGTTLAVIYSPHNALKDNPHKWTKGERVTFASLRWFLYSMSVAWVIFACEYGYAGLVKNILAAKFWIPLSRVNYAAYILHLAVINTMLCNIETALHFDAYLLVNYYLSSLLLSYACAFIFTVLVELPLSNLEALLIKK